MSVKLGSFLRSNILGLAALFFAITGFAAASIPDSNGMITGCYASNGTLRVIDREAGEKCGSGQTRLTWGQGATGPAGGDLTGTYPNPRLAADSVGSNEVAPDALRAEDLATNAVDSPEIAADAVTSPEIASGAVDSPEIASNAVNSPEIATDAVNESEIANNSVNSAEIQSQAVDTPNIATDAVDSPQIAARAIGPSEQGPVPAAAVDSHLFSLQYGGTLNLANQPLYPLWSTSGMTGNDPSACPLQAPINGLYLVLGTVYAKVKQATGPESGNWVAVFTRTDSDGSNPAPVASLESRYDLSTGYVFNSQPMSAIVPLDAGDCLNFKAWINSDQNDGSASAEFSVAWFGQH